MNKVILIGRLCAVPDLKETSSGTQYARYTLAVDRRFKKDGQQSADFIGCIAWGKSAEFAYKYLRKGMRIAIEGRIQTGRYEKEDGTTVYTTEVVVENHEFCEKKADSTGGLEPPPERDPYDTMAYIEDDQLPF